MQLDFEKFKTVNVISKETFDQITPQEDIIENQEVPPPPPQVQIPGKWGIYSGYRLPFLAYCL